MDSASGLQLRTALMDQLAYLLLEVASTETVLPRLADAELVRAGDGLTIRQRYGAIVEWDTARAIPRLQALGQTNGSVSEALNTDWNALPMTEVLQRVAAARRDLLSVAGGLGNGALSRLEEMCQILHETVQHDTAQLQAIAQQVSGGM